MAPDENPEWGLGPGLPNADAGSGEGQTDAQPAAVPGAEGVRAGSASAPTGATMGEGAEQQAAALGLPELGSLERPPVDSIAGALFRLSEFTLALVERTFEENAGLDLCCAWTSWTEGSWQLVITVGACPPEGVKGAWFARRKGEPQPSVSR